MSDLSLNLNRSLCPLCGKDNQCGMEIGKLTSMKQAACWCESMDFSADLLAGVPLSAQGQTCICPACATKNKVGRPELPA